MFPRKVILMDKYVLLLTNLASLVSCVLGIQMLMILPLTIISHLNHTQIFSMHMIDFATQVLMDIKCRYWNDDVVINRKGVLFFIELGIVSMWMAFWVCYGTIMECRSMLNSVSIW